MEESRTTILIVEDDMDVADMLNAYFRVQGYEVITAYWGEDGVRAAQTYQPSIVILDIRLPDIDGFEVARQLKANRRTANIPIVFLTEKRERQDKLKGLELHAEDYITKPFDVQELRLKVRNTLVRASQSTLTNPVSGLPQGTLVDEQLQKFLNQDGWAVVLVHLLNFETFHEQYSFVAADDLLRAVTFMLEDAAREAHSTQTFLGQINANLFVFITPVADLDALTSQCQLRFSQPLTFFYKNQDLTPAVQPKNLLKASISTISRDQTRASSLDQLKGDIEKKIKQA